jgi:hypothetical protein
MAFVSFPNIVFQLSHHGRSRAKLFGLAQNKLHG